MDTMIPSFLPFLRHQGVFLGHHDPFLGHPRGGCWAPGGLGGAPGGHPSLLGPLSHTRSSLSAPHPLWRARAAAGQAHLARMYAAQPVGPCRSVPLTPAWCALACSQACA